MPQSSMLDLRKFFNSDTNRTVSTAEFAEFWKSLSEEQKTDYKAQLDVIDGKA
jgi:hypothetical protein